MNAKQKRIRSLLPKKPYTPEELRNAPPISEDRKTLERYASPLSDPKIRKAVETVIEIKTMSNKTSPLPWHHSKPFKAGIEGRGQCEMIGIGNGSVHIGYASITSLVPEPEARANAALIVRACNSHAALLEACKAALREQMNILGYNPKLADALAHAVALAEKPDCE